MKRVSVMAKKKHTKIITEPDGTKVELDYSFRAFMDMVINHPPEKAAASIRRSRNARKWLRSAKEIAVRREIWLLPDIAGRR